MARFSALILIIKVLVSLHFVLGVSKNPKTGIRQANDEKFRLKYHFSINEFWINDPNGMVYLEGEYHLHYQYYPNDSVWGPMHWGHSVSRDLVTWTDLPIALYPDDLGLIFSGSAVADFENSAGFQTGNSTPIVAIFTHAGNSQQQSIAYSNDNGRTYSKFVGNPVVPNPGIGDFRDPKVLRYGDSWVMVLAAGNEVMFYGSKDLKSWELLSKFGENPSQGSKSGVWECPDLLKINVGDVGGVELILWVLLVSINPGGPNGGSVTQYFVGEFDGKTFRSPQTEILWMDWGRDNYAGVTFFNEPKGRHVLMGWMNNWDYAGALPTNSWRGQMTLPRVMNLVIVNNQIRLTSTPVEELAILNKPNELIQLTNTAVVAEGKISLTAGAGWTNPLMLLDLTFDMGGLDPTGSIAICILNDLQQEICTGYDKGREQNIFLDRERSGSITVSPGFLSRPTAVRERREDSIRFQIYVDISSVEVFIDGGLTCLTSLFYSDVPYTSVEVRHYGGTNSTLVMTSGLVQGLRSMDEVKA